MPDDVRAGARHSQGVLSRITCEDVVDGSLQAYDLPFCSQGLISNAILAIVTTRKYGVSQKLIRSRLLNWKQSEHRGVWIETETQHIYDDSYNANPDSMREALDAFVQGATEARPRLYVLGGMKELGDNGMALHREIGQELPLRSIDRAILIGEEALGYHEGMLSAGHREQSIQVFSDLDSAISQIMDFTGSVFLKGSNFYKLSNIVELVRHRSRQ